MLPLASIGLWNARICPVIYKAKLFLTNNDSFMAWWRLPNGITFEPEMKLYYEWSLTEYASCDTEHLICIYFVTPYIWQEIWLDPPLCE